MKICPLEEALMPGNIIEITSDNIIKLGVILSNNQVAYFKNGNGYDNIDSLVWRNNNACNDYYISRVYTPGFGFTIVKDYDANNLNCIYCRYPRYPYEVVDGVEYEMFYDGTTLICKNMNLFGQDVVVYQEYGSDTIEVERVTEFKNDLVVEITISKEDEE